MPAAASTPRTSPQPAPAATPAPAASSGAGLLDLFGSDEPSEAPAAPIARDAPGSEGALSNLLDLSPELPATPRATQGAPSASGPASGPAPVSAQGSAPVPEAEDQDAPRSWTDHFPRVSGEGWRQDDLRQGPRVIAFDRVQSGTGYLSFTQPDGLGTPGLVQAVAQLADGRLIGAPQGVRNRDPLVDYSARALKIHLRLLSQLQRFLVVFTPPQGLPSDAAAVVRMEDEFSQGSYEAHVRKLGTVRHVVAFSGFVVDGQLVVRSENRPFSGGIMEPFAAFGYALGAPQALGLMEHP